MNYDIIGIGAGSSYRAVLVDGPLARNVYRTPMLSDAIWTALGQAGVPLLEGTQNPVSSNHIVSFDYLSARFWPKRFIS